MRSTRVLAAASLGLAIVATTSGFTTPGPEIAGTSGFTAPGPSWKLTDTGVTAQFRGLAPVSDKIVWAAGSAGTILRTTDGGRAWSNVSPPAAAGLLFRDIEAWDARNAVALSIGEGDASRIFTTSDGGRSWAETFRNDDPAAFYDCVTFMDRRHGLA